MSVVEVDPVSKAALEISEILGKLIDAEAVVVIVVKREGTNIVSKSRLSMSAKATIGIEDVQAALAYAIEDVAEEERPLS